MKKNPHFKILLIAAIILPGVLIPKSSKAATLTTVRFDNLTPTVSGPGSVFFLGTSQSVVSTNTVSGFGLPAMPGGDLTVMSLPAFTSTQGISFNTGVPTGNGGGNYINQYTMFFDVFWMANPTWFSFFNTDGTNETDGDFFRQGSTQGIGYSTYYGEASPNAWHRVAITVDIGTSSTTFKYYLNGALEGVSTRTSIDASLDNRFSLYRSGDALQTILFGDNNEETGPFYLSQFAFSDRVFSDAEIAGLGGVSMTAIPEPGVSWLLAATAGLVWLRSRRFPSPPENR